MDSLANYGSDGENSDNSEDPKTPDQRPGAPRRASDANYDPVQMDMSEDSNNNNSSDDSDSERAGSLRGHQKSEGRAEGKRTTPEQRRPDDNSSRDDGTKRERSERSRHEDKSRRGSDDRRSEHRDRRSREDDRRREKNSDREDERRRDKTSDRDHHHRDDRRDRRRDRDRRHSSRKDRHREERSSHHKEKEQSARSRTRSRSRSKERPAVPYRPMTYREEKGRNKLAQLEKLGIELKTPEGTPVTTTMEQSFYNPLATATQGKYAEQIQKRKLLWANKSKPDAGQPKPTTGTTNTWVGTTFTHDQDGKMTAKFKRLMGIKEDMPAPAAGPKPDILKKQEEMFNNMEQQYEVARATTHTQRGVGLGYASGGYQFPR